MEMKVLSLEEPRRRRLNGNSTRTITIFVLVIATFGSDIAKADGWTVYVKQIEALEKEGRLENALARVTELIGDLKRIDPANKLLAEAVDRKASLEQDLGRYAEAERDYTEAIAIWRARGNGRSSGLATELNNLASLFSAAKQGQKSEALHRESLELRIKLLGADHPEVALSYSNLAVDLFREERYGEAAATCQQALAIWAKADTEHNRADLAYNTLALIELREGNFGRAVSFATLALTQYSTRQDADAAQVAGYRHTLALAREATGELASAEREFKDALALLDGPAQNTSPLLRIGLLADYGRLLRREKRTKEARKMLRKAELEWNVLARTNLWQHTVDIKALLPKSADKK